MLRRLTLTAGLLASLAGAAILPESFAGQTRTTSGPVKPEEPAVWAEYGLIAAEQATYGNLTVTAWQMKDPTGAFAAHQWQRGGAQPYPELHDNYLVRVEGGRPGKAAMTALLAALPGVVQTSPPPLPGYLPKRGLVPRSERYLLGPMSLAMFEPRLQADLSGLDRGSEAQVARYRVGDSEVQLTLISYPTPQMAIVFTRKWEQVPNLAVRRTGPIVALVPEGKAVAGIDRFLNEVNYRPNIMWNEYVSKHTPQDAAKMILAIATLAGGLIVFAALSGVLFGGSKFLAKKFGMAGAGDDFTSLHLGEK